MRLFFFFFNDTATTEIYTLSLHDALPISTYSTHQWDTGSGLPLTNSKPVGERNPSDWIRCQNGVNPVPSGLIRYGPALGRSDRKSTRLNSSHLVISYAVFCLKKKRYTAHCSLLRSVNPYFHAVPLTLLHCGLPLAIH